MTVSKDAGDKVIMLVIGDEKLYVKNYVIEPRKEASNSVTSNPAYVGNDPVTINIEATTQVIVVETVPIVQYVYSPFYMPYYPTYYFGYYPPYWNPYAVIGISIYRHHHYHHHQSYHVGYHGHGNTTVVINNHNSYNNYRNNSRTNSVTVNNNIKNGNFKTSGQKGLRPSTA
ncbi:hypothetical protein [Lacinutrix jangbogonensis]|uniref:hypothetical protein n=1 Tax=Lacinutrix jangbogonensis TaxID=1469557 RepID=UPI00068E8CE6|nr:hypothetical protein [Lacinutrix jangbogonensis]